MWSQPHICPYMKTYFDQYLPISVLIPVYYGDRADWFDQAMRSLTQQTQRASELIVVQDGPISSELNDRIRFWLKLHHNGKLVTLPENQGIPAALNAGIQAATQPWIARMDADDISDLQRFEIQWDFLVKNPDVVIVGSWIDEYDESMTTFLSSRRPPVSHSEIYKFAHWRCPFNHQTVIYRRDAVLSVGGYPLTKVMGEDYVLWTRLLHAGYRTANIPRPLVKVRAGRALIHRRRGWHYLRLEYKSMSMIYRMGFFTWWQYLLQLCIRTAVRLSPTPVVRRIYSRLRK
ncbi:glycosyl transferase family 2 [Schleiferia thermophila]|uniref:Glycosyl transferase family 2 n=2 Tax=Schleiferia thermophila TaxID=884107 RepID=A0A369AC20_9FLAO|nr:glycosyl transferase family 2 [Schleiferia thermophila]